MHAKTYVDIQSFCFDHRVSIHFAPIPKEISDVIIPRLIMQPLLENSFNHVFENQLSEGILSVQFEVDEASIRIIIEDNGKQLDDDQLSALSHKLTESDEQTGESTGIINVHRRLRLKFGNNSGLRLSRSPLGGLMTQIVIERKEVSTRA